MTLKGILIVIINMLSVPESPGSSPTAFSPLGTLIGPQDFFRQLKDHWSRLTDDEAHGGGDGHHSPGQSHRRIVNSLGRAHNEAAAHPGSCDTNKGKNTGGGGQWEDDVSDCWCLLSKKYNCVFFLTKKRRNTCTHHDTWSKGVIFTSDLGVGVFCLFFWCLMSPFGATLSSFTTGSHSRSAEQPQLNFRVG